MAKLTEKKTVTSYTLELNEKEVVALQQALSIFWPKDTIGDVLYAVDEVLGDPKDAIVVAYEDSVFDNKVIETEITHVIHERDLDELMNNR